MPAEPALITIWWCRAGGCAWEKRSLPGTQGIRPAACENCGYHNLASLRYDPTSERDVKDVAVTIARDRATHHTMRKVPPPTILERREYDGD